MRLLRVKLSVIAPPPSAGIARRIGGVLIVLLAIVAVIVLGFGIVKLVALPFGGIGNTAWFYGFLLVVVVLAVLAVVGRRRQRAARARVAKQRAAAYGGKR
jgi:membrane protein implicated in regulation of membrane protease activity